MSRVPPAGAPATTYRGGSFGYQKCQMGSRTGERHAADIDHRRRIGVFEPWLS
jgi:hypothetical protein